MSDFPTTNRNHLVRPVVGGCPGLAAEQRQVMMTKPKRHESAEGVAAIGKERGWIE